MYTLEIWHKHIQIVQKVLGAYLLYHFIGLWNWAYELFGQNQMLESIKLNSTYKLFPNILVYLNHSEFLIKIFLLLLIIASLFLLFEKFIQPSAIIIWYGWTCLFNANNLILNPGLPYIGWLLLAIALIGKNQSNKYKELYWIAWLMLGIGYFISGVAKLQSPSWIDGSALEKVLNNPLARDNVFREIFISFAKGKMLNLMTWFTLILELAFLPFIFFKFGRKMVWITMVGLHLGILMFINFTDLTLGMIVFHMFVIDWSWLGENRIEKIFLINKLESNQKINA